MKEVYCKNCEFEHGYLVCYWDAIQLLREEIMDAKKDAEIEKKEYLNERNNCKYYKRKWWKFWVA